MMRLQWRKYGRADGGRCDVLTTEDGTPVTVDDKRPGKQTPAHVVASFSGEARIEFYSAPAFAAHGWAPHVERYTWEQARKLIDEGATMRSPSGFHVRLDGGIYSMSTGGAFEFEPADFDGEWTHTAPRAVHVEDDRWGGAWGTAPAPEPPAEDDPSTHAAPRPGVWYRVLPRSEQGALVARFPFCALLGRRLEYRTPDGRAGTIEAYDYDLPEPCEFRVVEAPPAVPFYDADLDDFRGRRVEVVDARSGGVIDVIENYEPRAAQVGRAALEAGVDLGDVALRVLD